MRFAVANWIGAAGRECASWVAGRHLRRWAIAAIALLICIASSDVFAQTSGCSNERRDGFRMAADPCPEAEQSVRLREE